MTSCTGSMRGGFGGIWKKSVSWELDTEREGSTFGASKRPDEFARYGRRTRWGGGADVKVIIERLCISLPYVETFNSKVIKGFVPELRSLYVVFVFRDSYVLCIYVMNILCTFHISVSWVWYISKNSKCSLCRDRNERVNHIISICNKQVKIEWERWINRNCAWDWNEITLLNGICKNQNLS